MPPELIAVLLTVAASADAFIGASSNHPVPMVGRFPINRWGLSRAAQPSVLGADGLETAAPLGVAASAAELELEKAREDARLADAEVASARLKLSAAKGRLSDAGREGYARAAATVQDCRRLAADGKREERDRALLSVARSFAGVMDDFEAGPRLHPAPAAGPVHGAYQVLHQAMLAKFEDLGLAEYHAVRGGGRGHVRTSERERQQSRCLLVREFRDLLIL